MITLTKRLKQETETGGKVKKEEVSRVSIRDKLLVKEVQEMEENKPQNCKVKFDDPSSLHDFFIIISPEEGFWQGGRFKFHVKASFSLLGTAYWCHMSTLRAADTSKCIAKQKSRAFFWTKSYFLGSC